MQCMDCRVEVSKNASRCHRCAHIRRVVRIERKMFARLSADFADGSKRSRLTIHGEPFTARGADGKLRWHIRTRCECGVEKAMLCQNAYKAVSCGCMTAEICVEVHTTHGGSRSRLYKVWKGMHSRCYHESHKKFKDYGGRGITVCESWLKDFAVFREWAMVNGWTPELEIDRRDNDGNYCPENCRIVTHTVNNWNKRTSVFGEAFGETKCLAEWAHDPRCVVSYGTIQSRLKYGWALEAALKTPVLDRESCGRLQGYRSGKNTIEHPALAS